MGEQIIAFATFGSITYGYCSAIIGSTLGQPSFLTYFGLDTASNSTQLQGAINGLFQGGGLIGVFIFGYLADKLGRRAAIFVGTWFAIAGGALQAGSVHIAMFLVARFVTGVGVGGLVMLVPLWQTEVSPPHRRGLLVGLHGVSILFGYSVSAWVGYAFYFVQLSGAQWRPPLAIQCIFPIILSSGIFFIPESPRWLIENDRYERADAILRRIHHSPDDPTDETAQKEAFKIQIQLKYERTLPSSWRSLFTLPHYRKRAWIGFLALLAGQLTGTIVLNNYGPSLYKSLGHTDAQSLALAAGWLTEGIVCNIFNAILLDFVGRKWLMTTGLVGCAVSLIGLSIMVALFGGTDNKAGNSAGVFFLYLHLTFYATCLDASTYVFGSEIWPTHLRAKGFAISCAGLFVGSLALTEAAATALKTISWKFFLIMMAFTVVDAIIFAVWFPETKGLTLEEMAAKFGDEVVVEGEMTEMPEELSSGTEVATNGKANE